MAAKPTQRAPRKLRVTGRPGEGVIVNEPCLIRFRKPRGALGQRLLLEIVTERGKVKALKRD